MDIPQFLRISIEKNNVTLNVTDSNEVQFSTAELNTQQYGLYKCIIATGKNTFEKTMYLQNKGKAVVFIYVI